MDNHKIGTTHKRFHRLLSGILAIAMMAGTFLDTGVSVVQAKEPEKGDVVVTLMPSEHGTLSFDGSKGDTLETKAGTTVTVKAEPEDGYQVSYIAAVDDDGVVEDLAIDGNKATFEAKTSVRVTASYDEIEKTEESDARPLEMEVDETAGEPKAESVEDYILKHADKSKTGNGSKLQPIDMMAVAHTFVDGKLLPNATLDKLWLEDKDKDGYSDNVDAFLSQSDDIILLYRMSEDAKYFVGKVGDEVSHAKVTDWSAGMNNRTGTTYDDIIYDDANRLVYVPNKYQTVDEKGVASIYQTKLQLLYTVSDMEEASAKTALVIENDGVDGNLLESGNASGSYATTQTEFVLAKDNETAEEFTADMIDKVIVNGIEFDADSGMWGYDSETNKLVIKMSPATVDTVDVKMSDGLIKDIKRFFGGFKADASTLNGKWIFDTVPAVGDSWDMNVNSVYTGTATNVTAPPLLPGGGSTDALLAAFATWIVSGGAINEFNFEVTSSQLYWTSTIIPISGTFRRGEDEHSFKIETNQAVNLKCMHIDISDSFEYNDSTDIQGNWGEVGKNVARFRIMSVTTDPGGMSGTIVCGMVVPTANSQAGGGSFSVRWEVNGGKVRFQKKSDQPDCTDGSSLFDMTGAKYGIFRDKECTQLVEEVAVIDNTGLTNYSSNLNNGTYYVKETKAPNKGYILNPKVKKFNTGGDSEKTIILGGNMAETPINDPINILVQKAVTGTDKAGEVMGDISDLAGIQFKVSHYNELFNSVAEAERHTPTMSAIWETDDDGYIAFSYDMPVSGTWKYKDEMGNYMPLGTVVIEEHKVPNDLKEFLKPSDAKFAFQVKNLANGIAKVKLGTWSDMETDGAIGAFENSMVTGSLEVHKASVNSNKSEDEGDGSLEGIEYTVYNRSKNAIKYKGRTIPGSSECTDANKVGTMTTARHSDKVYARMEDLPAGSYRVVETKGTPAWRKANWAKNFSISRNKTEIKYDTPSSGFNTDEPTKGSLEVVKKDKSTGKSEPQGNATLAGVTYEVTNVSLKPVYYGGNRKVEVGGVVGTMTTAFDTANNRYSARIDDLPYGTYKITETGASAGYNKDPWEATVEVHEDHVVIERSNTNPVKRGGVSVTKADLDWNRSEPQGDATLENVTYEIVNRSQKYVTLPGSAQEYAPGSVVMTIRTAWDEASESYVAKTDASVLPYGSYEIREKESSVGYLNANWKQTFTIDDEKTYWHFKEPEDRATDSGLNHYRKWNVNPVQRGGIIVGKGDRELKQSIPLGEATFEGTTFKIINRSQHAVYVNGKTYAKDADIMTITVQKMNYKGKEIYAATTGEKVLPYGTYEIKETSSGTGYLYDSESKAYTKTVQIRKDGEMKELLDTEKNEIPFNQVIREDFHFKKKQEDSMERMENIPFIIESLTTGERHVIITDENGTWHSTARDSENWAGIPHTYRTNANDPTSPISNGAIGVDADGNWYVKDASKLDNTAGTWFTGLPEDKTQWAADGKSYTVNGKNVTVKDDKRAFPYDTYRLQEMRCPNNEGYGLISVTVTLHKYTSNHDGPGIDIDYGTLDDKKLEIGTILTNKESGGKVAPANADVTLTDTVTYSNLVGGKKYTMKGELHRVSKKKTDDGVTYVDEGVIATATKDFTPQKGSGRMTMDFTFKSTGLDKKFVVAFEYLMENGQVIASHEDLEDEDQTVTIPEIKTTLNGDLGHMANPRKEDITLVDTITYSNFEVGKQYVANGTLMKKVKGEDGKVTAEPVKDADGNPVVASTTFVAMSESGTVDVTFKFKAVDMGGTTVVAFENVTHNGVEYAVHADIEDENQTNIFPEVDTFALDGADANKDLAAAEGQTIKDAVKVWNIEKDYEYKLVGELHVRGKDGADEGVLMDKDDKAYASEVTFKGPENGEAVQTALFEGVDASKLGGKDIVVFQSLYGKGAEDKDWVLLYSHDDISDDDQAVHVPLLSTTLVTGQEIHESQVPADGKVELKDTIAYENVTVGHAYTITGVLHVQDIAEDGSIKDGGEVKNGKKSVTGRATFVAEKTEGTAEVTFVFDAHGLEGKSVTAFEYLYSSPVSEVPDDWKDQFEANEEAPSMDEPEDGWKVASHEDITDMGQTVHFADIETTLTGNEGIHESQLGEDRMITLTDVVKYTNLIPGREYTVTGTLHKQVVDEDGNITDGGPVMMTDATPGDASKPEDTPGDASKPEDTPAGTEDDSDKPADMEGEADAPADTDADKPADTDAEGEADTDVDKAEDSDKPADTEGEADTDVPADKPEETLNGTPVTATTTFIPTEANGEVAVTFTFDASELENGQTVVAFEDISVDGIKFAVHADITDESQSVHFVKIGTTASGENGLHEIQVPAGEDKTVTITDTVKYENVIPGTEYMMSGTLHRQVVDEAGNITDGGAICDKDGNPVVGTAAFTAKEPNGTVDVTFTFDASELNGMTVVAFETLTKDEKHVAHHEDITDEEQSIHFVELHTTATTENGTHETQVPSSEDKTVTITDRVTYRNLIPGTEYTVSGVLHKQRVDKDGNITDGGAIASTAKTVRFTPETPNGYVDVVFTIDASELAGQTVVAFEDLQKDGITVAAHADITDESQSVHFVKIGTTALANNKQHMVQVPANGKVTITDTVAYENLTPGRTYTVSGSLHVQDVKDGKPADGGVIDLVSADDGKAAAQTVEKTFVPETANGTVEMAFTFDASKLDGKTAVAFEAISYEGKVIATHEDITDEAQSVHFVSLATKALAKNGKHEMVLPGGDSTNVTDLVEYKNLIPGLAYTIIGEFHVKAADGKDEGILADAKKKPVRASVTFTPDKPDGSVVVDFEIPTKGLGDRTIVAFETLIHDNTVIARHADITDEAQSITFTSKKPAKKPQKPETPAPAPQKPQAPGPNVVPPNTPLEIVKTGQAPFYLIFASLGLILMAGGGYFFYRRKRK